MKSKKLVKKEIIKFVDFLKRQRINVLDKDEKRCEGIIDAYFLNRTED